MFDLINNHLSQWLILMAVLVFLIYSMFAIKNEKKDFIDEAELTPFFGLKLLIPKWWSIKEESEKFITYHRSDTRYDWFAKLEVIQNNKDKLEDILDNFLKKEQIIFDQEALVETKPSHLFKSSPLKDIDLALRVEGKASEKIIHRLYLDIYIFQYKENAYFFLSRSSVLNGIVEGPFFEEMVYLAEIN